MCSHWKFDFVKHSPALCSTWFTSLNINIRSISLTHIIYSNSMQISLLVGLNLESLSASMAYLFLVFKTMRFCALVGLSGLEPPTSRLSGVRSNRLSYKPIFGLEAVFAPCTLLLANSFALVEMNGIEPMTPCLQSRCSPSWATPPYSIEHRAIPLLFSSPFFFHAFWKSYLFYLLRKKREVEFFQLPMCMLCMHYRPLKIKQHLTTFLRNRPWMLEENILFPSSLHRKEVIQPHLPIRLPCYDFTPVANPTFDSVLRFRLDYWLRVLPAPMVWRAVCTRPGNVFTAACWSAITSNSNFM